jgi:hypothetical protein
MMVLAMAVPASAGSEKTTVCHVTHSVNNPAVVISVGIAAWNNGHDNADGLRPAKHQVDDREGVVGLCDGPQ